MSPMAGRERARRHRLRRPCRPRGARSRDRRDHQKAGPRRPFSFVTGCYTCDGAVTPVASPGAHNDWQLMHGIIRRTGDDSRGQQGQGMVEYALILVLIAGVVIAVLLV